MSEYRFPEIEGSYAAEVSPAHQKRLGQFFTPPSVARFMAEWILDREQPDMEILDPACGLGIFERVIRDVATQNPTFELWEIDDAIVREVPTILDGAKEPDYRLFHEDFLCSGWDRKYDGIISNPPYYKHHHIRDKAGLVRRFREKTGFEFSIQTNVCCWFLLKCLHQLKSGGRLAFILPGEFLNANYGEALKEYLLRLDIKLTLVTVDYTITLFDDAVTTSLILLAEKGAAPEKTVTFCRVAREKDLTMDSVGNGTARRYGAPDLDPSQKWKNYFFADRTSEYGNLVPLGRFGRFSRGIATGANDYFTVSLDEIEKYRLPDECLVPCISGARQVRTSYFTNEDYRKLRSDRANVHLFDGEAASSEGVGRYLKKGIRQGVHTRYLTGSRDPWYALENREVSRIWFPVFNRDGIKLVWNDTPCITLTCFHNFFPSAGGHGYEKMIYLYLHTGLAEELLAREKREYGNGLDKFEPNDITKAKIVDLTLLVPEDRKRLEEVHSAFIRRRTLDNDLTREAEAIFRSYI